MPIPAFVIISPLRTVRSVEDLVDEEAAELGILARDIRRAMRDVAAVEDAYLFQNEDSRHGFHLWMFPRYDWMEPFGRKVQSVRPIMDYAQQSLADDAHIVEVRRVAAGLREHLSRTYPLQKSS